MIRRIFIANRGDIAARIALSAGRLGMESVCLSEARPFPAYLRRVVTRLLFVAEESPALYLDGDAMVRYALETGCNYLHPGFGFLSEHSGFARKVKEAGLIWIGPEPDVIEKMGDKSKARRIAQEADIPCLQGLSGLNVSRKADRQKALSFADNTGFPLLIKASLGGGGKGMRVVREKTDLLPSLERAASEAQNAFGNQTLMIERYCESARHLEVQILGDQKGRVMVLGDRDCSLQRRHQKIIEEAPAPFLTEEIRSQLHSAGLRLASSVGYTSAGTVEFLLEPSRGARGPMIWFLEMNTRLQVEHPVTEEVYGCDLVAWQIRIAEGEAIPGDMADRRPRGHSIEARVYCEDPQENFLPAPGPVALFLPFRETGIRWEIGTDETDVISGKFDPMAARIISKAGARDEALKQLASALKRTFFASEKNNIQFLIWLCEHPDVMAGGFDTSFASAHLREYGRSLESEPSTAFQETASDIIDAITQQKDSLSGEDYGLKEHLSTQEATRLAWLQKPPAFYFKEGGAFEGSTSLSFGRRQRLYSPGSKALKIHGEGSFRPDLTKKEDADFYFMYERNGVREKIWLLFAGRMYYRQLDPESRKSFEDQAVFRSRIPAPVPGKIIRIQGSSGDQVQAGDALLVLESMKMEFEVRSPHSGRIKRILVASGDQVDSGQTLVSLEEDL